MKQLPILYSRTSNGSIQQWQIVIENSAFYTIEGLKDGKLTTSTPTICECKSIGKANETSSDEQASREAQSKWKKKVDSGYYEDITQIDIEKFTEPMLAKNFEDEFSDSMFPVYGNKKFDGMRCVVRNDGMWSRNGKKIVSAPHIHKALKSIFDKNPNAIFDGELYCHKFNNDFNKIISLAKKSKPSDADLEESANTLQYFIYDFISEGKLPFSKRHALLLSTIPKNKSLVVVDAPVINNRKELDDHYGKVMEEGYEGQIIRLDKPYEHKRSKFLLKRKEFKDAEYKVLEVVEGIGNRSGTAGYMVLHMADSRTFKSNIKGDFPYLKKLLIDKKNLVGKLVTVKFFCLTPDGIPRFPYVIAVRDYE
jgi:ATP-dependent DNA ligase